MKVRYAFYRGPVLTWDNIEWGAFEIDIFFYSNAWVMKKCIMLCKEKGVNFVKYERV